MISFDQIPKLYLVSGSTDLRKGINGYAAIVQSYLKMNRWMMNVCLSSAISITIKLNVYIGMVLVFGYCINGWRKERSNGISLLTVVIQLPISN